MASIKNTNDKRPNRDTLPSYPKENAQKKQKKTVSHVSLSEDPVSPAEKPAKKKHKKVSKDVISGDICIQPAAGDNEVIHAKKGKKKSDISKKHEKVCSQSPADENNKKHKKEKTKKKHKKKDVETDDEKEQTGNGNNGEERHNEGNDVLLNVAQPIESHENTNDSENGKLINQTNANEDRNNKYINDGQKLEETSSRPTVSVAVAGSIIDNAQSLELKTLLAGQIGRAAAVFRIDEIVVFDDYDGKSTAEVLSKRENEDTGGLFMVRILEYMEVPQYLKRVLIPVHKSLVCAGKLPPLDAPHHLRRHEWHPYREGVVVNKTPPSGSGSMVDVGLDKEVQVEQSIKPGTRVTVHMGEVKTSGNVLQVVDREVVRQTGKYWGYKVRYASCLSAVFEECPFEGKYDYCIGTSEHGKQLRSSELHIPKCNHLLIVFGGLSGLEESLELDKKLKRKINNISRLFNQYLNTCPNQGSRTIRTEEAILISLQFLQEAVQKATCV